MALLREPCFSSPGTCDRPNSDVDLAALFGRRPSAAELLDVRGAVERYLGRSVDLIDLKHASPIVARQALRSGVLLVDGSPSHRARFAAGLPGRYEDLMIVRRNVERALLERLTGQNGRSRDIVLAKAAVIDRCLARISEVRTRQGGHLLPIDIDDITLVNLTRAVQATLDLAAHVVATEGYGLPDTLAATFTLLEKNGIVDSDLADRLRRMTGFRNIAVHDYQTVDPRIVSAIIDHHLVDLRRFVGIIVTRFNI